MYICMYIYVYIYIFSWLCITPLYGAPTCSYFVKAENKVMTLQSGYDICTKKLLRDVALSLFSTKYQQWKHSCSVMSF